MLASFLAKYPVKVLLEVKAGGKTENVGGEVAWEGEGAETGADAEAVAKAGENAESGEDGSESGKTTGSDFWLLWPGSKGSMARC